MQCILEVFLRLSKGIGRQVVERNQFSRLHICAVLAHIVLTFYFNSVAAYIPASCCAGPSVTSATDKTGQKVTELQQPVLRLPPALDELQAFVFCPLAAKISVTDSFYNGLVAHNDSLKATIKPASLSGADVLAALAVSALTSESEGGDEIVIAGIKHVTAAVQRKQDWLDVGEFWQNGVV